jgi:hypothetical protein
LSLVECLFLSGIRLFFPHAVDFFPWYPFFRRVGHKSMKDAISPTK